MFECHAESDGSVLCGVVVINMEIALALEREGPARVLGKGMVHLNIPTREDEMATLVHAHTTNTARREKRRGDYTWSRNPMPESISIAWVAAESMASVIWMSVSFVLRATVAVRSAVAMARKEGGGEDELNDEEEEDKESVAKSEC